MARVVARARPLDLDHLGAEIGEQLRAPRPGEHAAEVEHPDPRERLHRPRRPQRRSASTALRRIMPRRARHAAARMRARPAQIEPLQRHPIIGRADHRPRAEQLVEPHLAVENVAADQPEAALEVERRMDLPPEHRAWQPRRMAVDRGDDRVRRFLALVVPAPSRPEIVAEMLAEQARDMLALGREARVERRGDQHLDDRLLGPAVAELHRARPGAYRSRLGAMMIPAVR